MMSLVDATLGRGAILGYSIGNQRFPGKGFISMHSDDSLPAPFPEWPMTTNCLVALDDWNSEAAGPTWVIPGSHKTRRPPNAGDEQTGGVPILMPKGSLLALTSNVWHWQGDRSDPGIRVTINAHYFRRFLRPHETLVRDEKVLHRNPPRLHELLGLDDGCENGPFEGRDYKRFQYMAELNEFNDARRSELFSKP